MAGLDPAIFVSAAASGRMRALERGRGDLQVLDEELILPRLGVGIRKPEQVGRMHRDHRLGCDHVGTLGQVDDVAAVLGDWRDLAEHRLRRGRAQRHHQGRADRSELTLVPLPAGLDLRRRRLLVQPDLAAGDDAAAASQPETEQDGQAKAADGYLADPASIELELSILNDTETL